MAAILYTKTGRVIPCENVTAGNQFPVLNIHTNALTGAAAYALFSDPEETGELTVEEADRTRVFRDFTQLHSVGPSPFYKGALMIWLNKPAEEEE